MALSFHSAPVETHLQTTRLKFHYILLVLGSLLKSEEERPCLSVPERKGDEPESKVLGSIFPTFHAALLDINKPATGQQ
ncbi:MAG: hypothetical protein HOQ35_00795 [Acidobacteriaceae bacterium]|nr:hypothetical protein [Acidobacteriaceae bacterium]